MHGDLLKFANSLKTQGRQENEKGNDLLQKLKQRTQNELSNGLAQRVEYAMEKIKNAVQTVEENKKSDKPFKTKTREIKDAKIGVKLAIRNLKDEIEKMGSKEGIKFYSIIKDIEREAARLGVYEQPIPDGLYC